MLARRDTADTDSTHHSGACIHLMFFRYVLFALLATAANLLVQEASIRLVPQVHLTFSMLAGTIAGFILKYVLDKKWVFEDAYADHRQELRKISLYGAFSVVTTLIFWGFEIAFWTIWQTNFAKYTGAVLGLAVGYAAKFLLDRIFVFKERQA